MASVSDPDVSAFLSEGTRTGILGDASASGRPLVTPVWFILEGGGLVFNTGKDTAKGRALQRDPRATMVVNLQEPPYGFVQVQGDAELSEDPGRAAPDRHRDRGPLHGGGPGGGVRQAQRRTRRARGPAAADQGHRRAQRDRLTA